MVSRETIIKGALRISLLSELERRRLKAVGYTMVPNPK